MHILLNYILPFIALMGALVFVHELGHFLAARALGIKVTDFAVGMGPTLLSRTDSKGIRWRLCALPIGGFVKMLGDADIASASGASGAFTDGERQGVYALRPPGHRAIVTAAGPFANFLFAFLVLFALNLTLGEPVTPPVVARVLDGSPAAAAGIRQGDRVTTIDGVTISRFEDVVRLVAARGDRDILVGLDRAGELLEVHVAAESATAEIPGGVVRVGRIGIGAGETVSTSLGPIEAARRATSQLYDMTRVTLEAVAELVTFRKPIAEVGGPVRIAEMSGDVIVKFGAATFVALAAAISLSIGVMNLLPIPVLDGGSLLLCLIEAVRGRPASPKTVARLATGGAIALLCFFVAVTVSDISLIVARLAAG